MAPLKLPDTVASPQDLVSLIAEIKDYAKWFSHESIKKQVAGSRVANTPELSVTANQIIRGWATHKPLSRESFDDLIKTLENYASSSPSITFTLAGPAPGDLKKTLVGWCRENIAPNAMVSFRFNRTILGGLVLQCGSSIFDWSFRRQLLENQEAFAEVLRHV